MLLDTWKITGDGFHFGEHGLGQEETAESLGADSLFAAMIARLVELEGEPAVEDFMRAFQDGNPPFVLSSTFPYAGHVLFFPLPASSVLKPGKMAGEIGQAHVKDLKKVQYVSEDLFRGLLSGESLADYFASAHRLQGNSLLVSPAEVQTLPKELRLEDAELWSLTRRPRVTLGRSPQTSTIFFTGRVAYSNDCGLWFGIRWMVEDTRLKNQVANLFMELGDAGLGGERSVGFGACQIESTGKLELPDTTGGCWVSLSRYLPRADEMDALMSEAASYRLETIGGWLDSPSRRGQRRKLIHLIAEGAVLGPCERPVPGRIVDARPSYESDPDPLGHAVYRSGLALAIDLKGVQ